MLVTYSPEGAEPQSFKFRPREIRASEAEMIERRAGKSFEQWAQDVVNGSATARRVLLWHLLRRQHPALKWEDTPDFAWSEILVEREYKELVDLRAAIANAKILEDSEREAALDEIDEEIAAREAAGDSPTSAS